MLTSGFAARLWAELCDGLQGGLPLALARSASVAALLSVFGTLVFLRWVLPRALQQVPPEQAACIAARLRRLARLGGLAWAPATLAWVLLQSAEMAGATTPAGVLAALPVVATGTAFGRLLGMQALALLAGLAVLGGGGPAREWVALALVGLATALQARHGHAASMYAGPSWLLLSAVLHLLAAGAWLGGLLPLLLVVQMAPRRAGAAAARWFTPLGKACVLVMAGSALFQGWVLIAGLAGLVGTPYGWVALTKIALLGVLVTFALANRYRFAPALLGDRPDAARRSLRRSLALQTGFGLAVLLAAAVLSGLEPSMHAQPLWPFAQRLSLDTVREDPDFRNEVLGAALALAGAVLLLATGLLLRRRWRWAPWPALAGAGAIAWLAVPHLDLLLVDAYPTSYYRSPTGFAATDIVAGAALFGQNCVACHGAQGRGDGPLAHGLPVPPANLTAEHLWMHADGELFWWLSHGIKAPEGGLAMPGFAGVLSPDQRWALVDYIRAHNAGLVARDAGNWTPPLQAPALQATCAGGRSLALADLRGGFVRLVFGPAAAPPTVPGVTDILVRTEPLAAPSPIAAGTSEASVSASAGCVADDEDLPQAYAIVTGTVASAMPGTQVLIDPNGWLRAVQHPGGTTSWNNPGTLLTTLRVFQAHPIAADAEMNHVHMQM
ncbi:MAG: CopD family protein [Janthinobacterium lividum]